jgi:hypothetical protein
MDPLTELAIKYKTDKWGKHHYTPYYYELFKNKYKKVRKVVEVGAGEGAGLRMFRDFFPHAWIYGAEIDPKRIFTEERIKVYLCNQSSKRDLEQLVKKTGPNIDLFIDDGSHLPKDQVFTCLTILPLLKKGAIYVVEDVADLSILQKISSHYTTNTIECGKRYDDRLIVIKK